MLATLAWHILHAVHNCPAITTTPYEECSRERACVRPYYKRFLAITLHMVQWFRRFRVLAPGTDQKSILLACRGIIEAQRDNPGQEYFNCRTVCQQHTPHVSRHEAPLRAGISVIQAASAFSSSLIAMITWGISVVSLG